MSAPLDLVDAVVQFRQDLGTAVVDFVADVNGEDNNNSRVAVIISECLHLAWTAAQAFDLSAENFVKAAMVEANAPERIR